jgi:putative lipoprotein
MDMKKIFALCCIVAAGFASVSCEKTDDGYTGTNYIYLTSGTNSMYDTENDAIDVTVQLTASLKEDLTLTLAVADDEDGIITLEGNPVTIAAGAKTGTVKVRTKELSAGLSSNFRITLDRDATVLPEKVAWKEDFTFTVHTSAVPEFTEEQKAIIEAYREKTGIDLTKYLGIVDVTTVYTASNPDSEIPDEPVTITGKTTIVLSEQATADQPVLKMTVNPMGLTDELYRKLKDLTVNNADWYNENNVPCYRTLMTEIGWTSESVETFSMTLDGIFVNDDQSVDFVKDLSYYDEEYEEDVTLHKVDFEYMFSAFEREKVALAAGKIGTEVDEDWAYDATVDPSMWLNTDDISEDGYEYGNYVEASATISDEKMVFTFPIYNYNDYDYSKVVATYTPNK